MLLVKHKDTIALVVDTLSHIYATTTACITPSQIHGLDMPTGLWINMMDPASESDFSLYPPSDVPVTASRGLALKTIGVYIDMTNGDIMLYTSSVGRKGLEYGKRKMGSLNTSRESFIIDSTGECAMLSNISLDGYPSIESLLDGINRVVGNQLIRNSGKVQVYTTTIVKLKEMYDAKDGWSPTADSAWTTWLQPGNEVVKIHYTDLKKINFIDLNHPQLKPVKHY